MLSQDKLECLFVPGNFKQASLIYARKAKSLTLEQSTSSKLQLLIYVGERSSLF